MYEYHVGGSLAPNHSTYVERSADGVLYRALLKGAFCYVFAPRQMGKSSLRLRACHRLHAAGYRRCVAIDMRRMGGLHTTPEQWYLNLAYEMQRKLGLRDRLNLFEWWKQLESVSPVQKLRFFIDDVLLPQYPDEPLFIFLDEIDSVKALGFPVGDFFRLIQVYYDKRAETPAYRRLTWALLGVATPTDLIGDSSSPPFQQGQAIHLSNFSFAEATPLAVGLLDSAQRPDALLREVLRWTGGQPFLTQKLCRILQKDNARIEAGLEAVTVDAIVRSRLLSNWELQDEPEHLRTIADRLLGDRQSTSLLRVYQRLLSQGSLDADSSEKQAKLKLSGIAIEQNGRLSVANPIYAAIFNADWVHQHRAQPASLHHLAFNELGK